MSVKKAIYLFLAWCSCTMPVFTHADFYTPYIDAIKKAEIMQGYADGSFKPDTPINRAEFTKTIIAAMYTQSSIEKCSSRILHFKDIDQNAWYIPYLCIAYNEDIIKGYPNGTFQPEKTISVAEASAILTRTFEIQTEQTTPWYAGPIESLKNVSAYPPTATAPQNTFLRKELAYSITKLLQAHEESNQSVTQFLQTSVVSPTQPINHQELLNILNGERRNQGLPELTLNQKLNTISQTYAQRMSDEQFFSHTDKNGDTTHERLQNGNYQYLSFGENIGVGQESEQEIMRWWIASPGHYENIIRPQFTQVGFGKAKVSAAESEYANGYYWVNTFARPR